MRMRKKKHLTERIDACGQIFITDSTVYKGKWREYFTGYSELHVEIGCGKGRFITEMAKQNPDVFFIAVEKIRDVLVMAMEKAINERLTNIAFIAADAALLGDTFAENEVDRIYLNFSDPWPSSRHAKRRLTYCKMLDVYKSFLKPKHEIHFKTDNLPLFEWSLGQFSENGFLLSEVCRDLHASGTPNIMTEYETRFSSQGVKINRVVAKYSKEDAE